MKDAKIVAYLSTRPQTLLHVTHFSLTKEVYAGDLRCDVEIVLKNRARSDSTPLRLRFRNAANITIGDVNPTLATMVDIQNVRQLGLEGIRYRVEDTESRLFSLDCEDFDYFAD